MDGSILALVFTFLGGTSVTAIITGLFNLKKNKADVTDASVRTVLEIEKIAMERYASTNEKLSIVEKLLSEVKDELEAYKAYVDVLTDLLKKNNIEVPKMDRDV